MSASDSRGVLITPEGSMQEVDANCLPPVVQRNTERDLQRAALRDLVALSTECATREQQIEQALQTALATANRQFHSSSQQIAQRAEAAIEDARKENAQAQSELSARFGAEFNALNAAERSARQRIETETDSVDRDTKEKLQQAIWLADSVLEATQNQVQAEYKKAREEAASHTEQLDALDRQAAALIETYGYRPAGGDGASESAAPADAEVSYRKEKETVERLVARLRALTLPRLFVGVLPYVLLIVLCLIAIVAAQARWGSLPQSLSDLNTLEIRFREVGYALGVTLAASLLVGWGLWALGRAQVRRAWSEFRKSMAAARHAVEAELAEARTSRDGRLARATRKRDAEARAASDKYSPVLQKNAKQRQTALRAAQEDHRNRLAALESQRKAAIQEAEASLAAKLQQIQRQRDEELAEARQRLEQATQEARARHDRDRAALQEHWQQGLARIQEPIGEANGRILHDWNDPYWKDWKPPSKFSSTVRFGELRVDLPQITDHVPKNLTLPESFSVPAILAFPRQSSLLIEYDRDGRERAIRTLQMVMTRLLVSLPPGRVRFTIIDPVGLGQNFAGFMHLADHDEALVGGRIWTESEHIDQRLANLTEHMETVIQKYLRNEFETIDDYNQQAGELAEPYRFLVIADFPHGFQGDAFRRLASIASTGARCGVYTLVARDMRVPIASGCNIDELEKFSVTLVTQGDRFVWKDEVFRQFPLTIDSPPAEQSLNEILELVGRHAKDASRVEVPFASIAPTQGRLWSMSATDELRVPVGRLGATRLQTLRLGKGVAQHALIAGKTGSGKSTLLHVLITNLAMWYHPDEVEFYLVDFKKGVEFKTYATHLLPHARAIAVESDREFGLSVLQRVDAELTRRGELYRKLGVQDLAGYRAAVAPPLPLAGEGRGEGSRGFKDTQQSGGTLTLPSPGIPGEGKTLPRTLLIIDEFQEFFSEDDKLAQDAALLLDRLVRQGRAFGIHLLLGSQTIGGTSGLARSTIGQMAVRVALQTSEADSQLILGDNNSAARLLSRPGEAIYNDASGLVEANSPFQVAWLPDDEREGYLKLVRSTAQQMHADRTEPPVVFEGNAPADIRKNRLLAKLIESENWTDAAAPLAWVGEPVAIKDPTSIPLRRVSGANLLIIGQQQESALGVMLAAMISLAVQQRPGAAKFVIFDGTPADSPLAGMIDRVRAALPHESSSVEYRAVGQAIAELHRELQRRLSGGEQHAPSVYLMIYGLQRYRALRHQEESFSFSSSDEDKSPQTDKQFAELLREGPALGMHVLAWCDTPIAVERTLDRASMREFDHRILFQMSAADSSNLIDSPAAGKLGFHRALAYGEEQGTLEKFRPYAAPDRHWLEQLAAQLRSRHVIVSNQP